MDKTKSILLSLLGATVGGTLGYFGFRWLISQNLYGLVLPGGLLGLGAGIGKSQTRWLPFVTAPAALMLGLFAEWSWAPFIDDPSLGFFITHLKLLKRITVIMLAVGTVIAFWVPFRRR